MEYLIGVDLLAEVQFVFRAQSVVIETTGGGEAARNQFVAKFFGLLTTLFFRVEENQKIFAFVHIAKPRQQSFLPSRNGARCDNRNFAFKCLPNACRVDFAFRDDDFFFIFHECGGIEKFFGLRVHFPISFIHFGAVGRQCHCVVMIRCRNDNSSACGHVFSFESMIGVRPLGQVAELEMFQSCFAKAAPLVFGQFVDVRLSLANIFLDEPKKFFIL